MFAHAHRDELTRCFMEVDKREIMADFVSKCQNASTCELWDRMGQFCEALRDALLEISIATGRRSRNAGCMMIHYWHGVGCIRAMCSPQHEGSVRQKTACTSASVVGKASAALQTRCCAHPGVSGAEALSQDVRPRTGLGSCRRVHGVR